MYCIYAGGETARRFDRYATELSRRTGIRLVRISFSYSQKLKDIILRKEKSIVCPHVFDFISLIDNAKYVLTDSFHGTAFSLNLNTEPICIFPEMFGGRLASILNLTGTFHRRVESYDDFDVINRPVDFAHVNSVLAAERKKVSDWLKIVLAEIQEHNSSSRRR